VRTKLISSPLSPYDYEALARALAASATALADGSKACAFIAAWPLRRPVKGWATRILERAKQIRAEGSPPSRDKEVDNAAAPTLPTDPPDMFEGNSCGAQP
jgi:hypothetical protein